MRRMLSLATAGFLALLLAGCGSGNANNGSVMEVPAASTEASQSASPAPSSGSTSSPSASPAASESALSPQEQSLANAADEVMGALRDRDLVRLASWTDAEKGLRFSPYPHLNSETDLVFQADRFPSFKDDTTLEWGSYDGSGEPIKLSFRDYFEKFVYDQDFADAPVVSVGKLASSGNTTYNGAELYANSSFVEYHFPGFDKKLEGQDWESLILVFVPSGADWKLVSVVHGQWTI
ncbi:lipoprotein [Cohnella sp. AR92]|uniref:LptM family lipoprotein n=1 Tax=Cohnella sp. AR92 TaxID=648716 RepID=UPI000F8DA092|nr:hypothetical protein [Cohnella sp. AR92]RUS49143.1 hypothetical protein ELR57_02045 [Cohnella sp. AR92]